jgi:hypothetical protein
VSRSRHHADPEGDWQDRVEISAHERGAAPEWFAAFFDPNGLGHNIDDLFGAETAGLRNAGRATIVRAEFPDPPTLDYLRNVHGLVSAVLEHDGLGVYELFHCRWWTRAEWTRRFIDRCAFDVKDHVQIVVTDDERHHPGLWLHTRGMRKFGRPDLQIRHVPGPARRGNRHANAAGAILNDFAEALARGKVIPDGWTMHNERYESSFAFVATPDDSDSERPHFNNSVLEIVDLDFVAGQKVPRRGLSRLLDEIVGKGDS